MDELEKSLVEIIRKKAIGTIIIFERNDFYACYDDDAVFVADNVFCSEVGLRRCQIGEMELKYHVFNNTQYLRVIRDAILVQHYRVEVFTAVDGKWVLKAKGSLGCLNDFEEIVGDSVELYELTTVAALMITDKQHSEEHLVSIVSCNVRELQLTVAEFFDTEHFVFLEKFLAALVPRECIVIPNTLTASSSSLSTPEEINGRLNTALKKGGVNREHFEFRQSAPTTYSDQIANIIDPKYKDVHLSRAQESCIIGLIQYLHLNDDGGTSGKFRLRDYKSAGHMHINSAAVKALELFGMSHDDEDLMDEMGSLYDLLNKCRTPQGQRLLRDWMRRPLYDLRKINERLDVVEAFVNDPTCRTILHDDILRQVPDIAAVTRKLVQKKAGLQECYRLYQIICLMKRFHQVLDDLHASCASLAPSLNALCVEPLALTQLQFKNFVSLIETTMDIAYFKENGMYRIIPTIDENLLTTSEKMRKIEEECKDVLKKVCSVTTETVKLENSEHHGFHFRVTLKAEKSIRKSGMQILETSKGFGVRFTCDDLDTLNRDYLKLCSQYESIQNEYIDMVVETCAGYTSVFYNLAEIVAVIDILVALSTLAACSPYGYVRPQLLGNERQVLELKGCRHPVMETMSNSPPFISNDVILGNEEGDGAVFLILTGANMGGKSTYLRCCALTVLLGQIGSFVPCQSATFSLIDGIHTRIGSCDYQCKGVSTFMAEMNDCASILEAATQNSLVIVDELGRGTSTYDGFGLAWAIAEDIISRLKCFCIFATHYHELTELSNKYPKQLKNMCTTSQVDENGQLILLYKIVPGIACHSFGLNIAKMVGLPDNVLQVANDMLEKLQSKELQLEPDEEEIYKKICTSEDQDLRRLILENLE